MDYSGLLKVNDNIFKFLSLLGVLLILFAVIYPNEKLKDFTQLQSEAILKSKQLGLEIDDAIRLHKNLAEQTDKTKNQSVKDSLQIISDDVDRKIKLMELEINHLRRLKTFHYNELQTYYSYRYWILGSGTLSLFLGLLFWTIFYIKQLKKE